MGIYSDGNIYGVAWVHSHDENIETYTNTKKSVLTDEERQQIYSDFLRLIPEKDRPFYRYNVYTRCFSTYSSDPFAELSYNWMWFPLELNCMLEYFEKGSIVGF